MAFHLSRYASSQAPPLIQTCGHNLPLHLGSSGAKRKTLPAEAREESPPERFLLAVLDIERERPEREADPVRRPGCIVWGIANYTSTLTSTFDLGTVTLLPFAFNAGLLLGHLPAGLALPRAHPYTYVHFELTLSRYT